MEQQSSTSSASPFGLKRCKSPVQVTARCSSESKRRGCTTPTSTRHAVTGR